MGLLVNSPLYVVFFAPLGSAPAGPASTHGDSDRLDILLSTTEHNVGVGTADGNGTLTSGYVRDPVHASISIYSTAKKQSASVRGWMIRAILAVYCFGPRATAGSIVFSAGLAAMYHVWGRYDDASQLRFGGNYLMRYLEGPRSQHWLDLYICKHKNRQDGSTHHAIAASRDGSVGAFEAL